MLALKGEAWYHADMKHIFLTLLLALPLSLGAQELIIVENQETRVDDPQTYRAYYGELTGSPHTFTFNVPGDGYTVKAVVLAPDTPEVKTDIVAEMISDKNPDESFARVDGSMIEWQRFFDTSGRDSYLAGPVLETTLEIGSYRIQVSSPDNQGSYVLVFEGRDGFSLGQVLSRFGALPTIKAEFFGKSALEAYTTPLLLWPVVTTLLILAAVIILLIVYRRMRPSA